MSSSAEAKPREEERLPEGGQMQSAILIEKDCSERGGRPGVRETRLKRATRREASKGNSISEGIKEEEKGRGLNQL